PAPQLERAARSAPAEGRDLELSRGHRRLPALRHAQGLPAGGKGVRRAAQQGAAEIRGSVKEAIVCLFAFDGPTALAPRVQHSSTSLPMDWRCSSIDLHLS